MSKRILLVSPRNPYLDSDRVFPPLGIMYLKSALEQVGFYVELSIDFNVEDVKSYDNFNIIGFSVVTPDAYIIKNWLNNIKVNTPNIITLIGGPHANFYTEDCIQANCDYIIRGYGESAFGFLKLEEPKSISKIVNSNNNLEGMPLPYRSKQLLDCFTYRLNDKKATTMLTSRGCPFSCAFCEHANTKVHYYSTERLRQELIQTSELDYKAIMFFDDLFAVNYNRVLTLCNVIKEFNIIFRCFGHAKTMTHKIAKILAEAGCVETGVGFESGSQRILDIVKFPTPTVKESYEYIKICHEYGIKVKGFFILGLPSETKDTIKETEEFIALSGIDDFDLVIYYPYKGTKIRDNIEDYDLKVHEGIGYYKGIGGTTEFNVGTSSLSAEDIHYERNRIFNLYNRRFK